MKLIKLTERSDEVMYVNPAYIIAIDSAEGDDVLHSIVHIKDLSTATLAKETVAELLKELADA